MMSGVLSVCVACGMWYVDIRVVLFMVFGMCCLRLRMWCVRICF